VGQTGPARLTVSVGVETGLGTTGLFVQPLCSVLTVARTTTTATTGVLVLRPTLLIIDLQPCHATYARQQSRAMRGIWIRTSHSKRSISATKGSHNALTAPRWILIGRLLWCANWCIGRLPGSGMKRCQTPRPRQAGTVDRAESHGGIAPAGGGTGAGARSDAGEEVAGGYDGRRKQHPLPKGQ